MSGIQKLTIENFQSHRRSEIEPAPPGKLTVIVGPSDSGKTAIIRALKWLYYNRPQGAEFTRVRASMVRVTLNTGSNKVTRFRSASLNRYVVGDGTSLPLLTTLEGFGNDVPLEVQEVTGIRQTMIGDMPLNLNLAEQLDGPFLGSSISDPVRARILGKLAGSEEVDHANKQLGTDLYRRGQDKKVAEADIKRLTEELKQFESLPRLQEMVEQLGQMIESACAGINRARQLRSLSVALRDRVEQAKKWQAAAVRLARVEDAEKLKAQIDASVVRRAKLSIAREGWNESQKLKNRAIGVIQRYYFLEDASAFACDVDRGFARLKGLKGILTLLHAAEDAKWAAEDIRDNLAGKVGWAEIDLAKGTEIAQRRQGLETKNAALWGQGLKLTDARETIVLYENELAQYLGAYRDALLTAGQCPTCGGQVDPERLKGVI